MMILASRQEILRFILYVAYGFTTDFFYEIAELLLNC